MNSLNNYLSDKKGRKLLAIFPHPDDECFIAGGLFQIAKKYKLKTNLICLTQGGMGLNFSKNNNLKNARTAELKKSIKYIGIDNLYLLDYPDAKLRKTQKEWVPKVNKLIKIIDPDIVITFDYSGITGHPDHIASCNEIRLLVKKISIQTELFWRVPSMLEKQFFRKSNLALKYAGKPDFKLKYGVKEMLTKLKAIYSHESQMQGKLFKLRIFEWNLLEKYELYYKVDLNKKFKFKFVYYKIN